jgi:O-antigen ligase
MKLLPVAALLVAGALVLGHPGLLLGVVFHAFQYEHAYEIPYVGASALLAYLAYSLVLGVFLLRERIRLVPAEGLLYLFSMFYVATVFYAPDPSSARALAMRYGAVCLGYYALGRLYLKIERYGKSFLFDFGLAATVLTLAFGHLALESMRGVRRLSVGESSAVGFSQSLDLSLVFCATYVLCARPSRYAIAKRVLALVVLFAVIQLVLANATRGVVVSFVVTLFITTALYAFAHEQVRRSYRVGILLLALAVSATVLTMDLFAERSSVYSKGVERILMNFSDGTVSLDPSSEARLAKLEAGLERAAADPVLGGGLGSYNYHTGEGYPHNLFVEVLAETGTVGTVLLAGMVAAYVAMAVRVVRQSQFQFTHTLCFGLLVMALAHQQLSFRLWMSKLLFLAMGCLASLYEGHGSAWSPRSDERAYPSSSRTSAATPSKYSSALVSNSSR